MAIFGFLLAALFTLALAVLSMRAAERLAGHERLPMNWGVNGKPGWHAPRTVALAFTPVLGGATLALTAALLIVTPGTETAAGAGVLLTLAGMGAVWVAAHAGHLWLLDRWARSTRG